MELEEKLAIIGKYVSIKKKGMYECSLDINGLKILCLRDALIKLGRILEEDIEKQIYVAVIPSGIANKNDATLLVQLNENKLDILCYADEGLIKQNTAKKAVETLEDYIYKK